MSEQEFQDLLLALLTGEQVAFDNPLEMDARHLIEAVSTFEEVGVAHDNGLVVTLGDGSEFQITLIKSR
jgi:hypothetical protein